MQRVSGLKLTLLTKSQNFKFRMKQFENFKTTSFVRYCTVILFLKNSEPDETNTDMRKTKEVEKN